MKKSLPDIFISIILIAVLSAFASQMGVIPAEAKSYPMVILSIGGFLTFLLLIKSIGNYKREEKESAVLSEQHTDQLKSQMLLVITYVILIAFYIVLINMVGYLIATIFFVVASLIFLKFKSKVMMIVIAVVLTITIYYIFTRFLGVQLPRGTYVQFYF